MASRRTNLALLVLVPAAVFTGGLAFAIGTGWNRWATVAHAVLGFAIVLLAPWKSVIVRRGTRRRRPGWVASLAFGVVIVVALIAGVGHATGAARSWGPVTAMQVHVGAGLLALPLLAGHVRRRPERLRRADLDRRTVLRAGAVAGGAALLYGAVEVLPGGQRRFTGSARRGQPAVTQWLNDRVPDIDIQRWRLAVGERVWTHEQLDAFDDELEAVLDCTGGWYSTQRWRGARLDRLLGDAAGRSIRVSSHTGYWRRFPRGSAPRLLIATRMAGSPLTPGHGAPARLVAPGRRGFWWVKWVTEVSVDDSPWWWQPPFPLT